MDLEKNMKLANRMRDKEQEEPYRTIWRRILASFIDSSIFLSFNALLGFILFKVIGQNGYIYVLIISSFLSVIYNIILVYKFGGSLGKLFSKIKVLNEKDEVPVKLFESIKREILNIFRAIIQFWRLYSYILAAGIFVYEDYKSIALISPILRVFTYLFFIFGYIEIFSALFSSKRRAIHDYIAGTVVKKTDDLKIRTVLISIIVFVIAMKLNVEIIGLYR